MNRFVSSLFKSNSLMTCCQVTGMQR